MSDINKKSKARTGERRKNLILINDELKKNERILVGAEELSGVGGWEYELASGEIWHSDQHHRNFGYEPGSFPSQVDFFLQNIVHPDHVKDFHLAFEKIRETGEPVELDYKASLKSGEVHLFRSLCKARKDHTGCVAAIYGATLDITEQKAVEKALYESELKYRKLFNQAADTILVIDPNTADILEFNEKAHKSLGYSRPEFRRLRLSDLEIEETERAIKDRIDKALKEGSYIFETRHKKKNGEIRDIIVSATAISIGGKKLLQSIHYDITERKVMEEKLRKKEETLAKAQSIARIGSWEWDLRNGSMEWSDEAYRILGQPTHKQSPNLKRFFKSIHPEDRKNVKISIKDAFYKNRPFNMDHRVIHADGKEIVIVHEQAIAERDRKGRPLKLTGTIQDITERKKAEEQLNKFRYHLEEMVKERTIELHETNERLNIEADDRFKAEEALRKSERDLRSIINNMQDTFYRTDGEGHFIMLSPSSFDLMGYKPEELIGTRVSDLYEKPEERQVFIEKMEQSGGRLTSFETVIKSKNSSSKWVSTSARFYKDMKGETAGVEGIVRDITERKRMEEEIIKGHRLESIGILAGGIAHDFNNILTAILSNVEFLKEYISDFDPVDDSIFQILNGAESAVTRATKLTRQLLTFSKGGDPILEITYIDDLLKEAASFSLRGTNVKHRCYIPDDLWPVKADKNQMSQVINNIIINARHAMPNGGTINIRANNENIGNTSLLPLDKGRYVKFSISDKGDGISPENISRIFDPYFTTKGVGTGLGLATSYSIIKRHKGHIEVESKPEKGTTFHIYLPASTKVPVEKKIISEPPLLSGKANILLMEDEDIVANSFKILIGKMGYHIQHVKDGNEAIKVYEKAKKEGTHFDTVIMDLTIPGGMGGAETIKKLLKIDPSVKAIVCSGYSDDDVMSNFKKYGFCANLQKPFSKQSLLQVLSEVLK